MADKRRRLVALWAADVVGYSALMEHDEADTLARLFALRTQLVEPQIAERGGRVVKTTGDGLLAEFGSVVDAVATAVAVQEGISDWPDVGEPLRLRIGVHLGDVLDRDGDLFGDGVNIAARLEQAAPSGGVLISASAHDQLAGHHTGQFFDVGELTLKNIARPVRAWRWQPREATGRREPVRQSSKPSIAVLPFDNMSGDADQDFFADGMVDDLITMLSRFHWFKVIARNSSFAFRGQAIDLTEVGAKLGARYVLEGSVRRAGDRLRVTTQLIDTDSNTHIWAERFDRVVEDLFDLQDEIVQAIVGAIVPQFVSSFQSGPHTEPRRSVSSWELAMRGWNLAWRTAATPTTMVRARELFEQAVAEDPGNGLAYCGLSFTYGNPHYLADLERDLLRSMAAALQAVEIDERDAFAWCLIGATHILNGELDEAERALRRAISINPSLALAYGYLASVNCWRSDVAATDDWVQRMRELSPADPLLPLITLTRSMARFGVGDYGDALRFADDTIAQAPRLPSAWRLRAVCLEMLGDHDAAVAATEHMLTLDQVDVGWLRENLTPLTNAAQWEVYFDALRRTGVPD